MMCWDLAAANSLTLSDMASRPLERREVRIRVLAAGVNYLDTLIVRGAYQIRPPLPFAPGTEVAGEVIEIGDDVEHVIVGERVIGLMRWGGFAEEAVVKAECCFRMPVKMSMEVAAAFPTAYGTSYYALVQRANIQKGETLLVHGATGGVGSAAVDIARQLGVRTIAAGSDRQKLTLIGDRFGVDDLLVYDPTGDWSSNLRTLTKGAGVDVVFDSIGGNVLRESLRAINWGGRLLVVGFASGVIPDIPANLLLLKGCSAVGVSWGEFKYRQYLQNQENFDRLFHWYSAGELSPLVSRSFPLERANDALSLLTTRKVVGKTVLTT